MNLRGSDFSAALNELTGDASVSLPPRHPVEQLDIDARISKARQIWRAAKPIAGTLGATYLRARGISLSLPGSLRFCPKLWHAPSRRELPAVVAALQQSSGRVTAIQRTFLAPDGCRKASKRAKLA